MAKHIASTLHSNIRWRFVLHWLLYCLTRDDWIVAATDVCAERGTAAAALPYCLARRDYVVTASDNCADGRTAAAAQTPSLKCTHRHWCTPEVYTSSKEIVAKLLSVNLGFHSWHTSVVRKFFGSWNRVRNFL